MKKIDVEKFNGIHYHAICDVCSFSPAIRTKETPTRADVRQAVRKHVWKTGHGVTIESGKETYYTLVEV